MYRQMLSILSHLKCLYTTVYGCIIVLLTLLWNFINPEIYSFSVVGITILADLIWGIIVAKKQNRFILSEAIRNTFLKVNIYGCALLLIYAVERGLHDDWFIGTKVACAIAAACEFWSTSASMLIVSPNMPFLRLLRMQLKGEIEKKVGYPIDNVLPDKNEN